MTQRDSAPGPLAYRSSGWPLKLSATEPPCTASGGRIAPAMVLISVLLPQLDSPARP